MVGGISIIKGMRGVLVGQKWRSSEKGVEEAEKLLGEGNEKKGGWLRK